MAETVKPLLPFDPLPAGTPTAQFYLVINLNSFRAEVAVKPALSFEAAQPGSPADGELYVLDGDWGLTFQDEDGNPVDGDGLLAYYTSGTWYYFQPEVGQLKRVGTDYYTYDPDSSAAWQTFNPGGAITSVNSRTGAVVLSAADVPATIVTDATTARDLAAADMGAYLRFTSASAKALTVRDNADVAITTGLEVHGRNAGAGDLTITEDTAVTVNPPAGGTLVVPEGGTFTLKKVGTDEWDLFGVTVAA